MFKKGIICYSTSNIPAVISDGNTVAWYDSSSLTTITKDGSNNVSRWNDRLGSGRDLIQATGYAQPNWSSTGILFNGTTDLMAASFTINQPEFIYMVFKQITWNDGYCIFDGAIVNRTRLLEYTASPNILATAGTPSSQSSDLALDTFGIIRILFNGASSKLQVNNQTAITGNFGTAVGGGLSLGGNMFGCTNIQVKEIIIRKVADNSTDETAIYNYLKDKYAL